MANFWILPPLDRVTLTEKTMATAAGSDTEETIIKSIQSFENEISESRCNNDLEGYTYDFVDVLKSKEYECPICLHVVRNPVLIPCGDIACNTCWNNWASKQKSKEVEIACPLCRVPVGTKPVVEDNYLARVVRNLHVYCINYNYGCQSSFLLSDIEEHQASCGFQFVTCELDCGEMIMLNQQEHHIEKDCPRRQVKCPTCQSECSIQTLEISRKEVKENDNAHMPVHVQQFTATVLDLCATVGIPCGVYQSQDTSVTENFPINLLSDSNKPNVNSGPESEDKSLSLLATVEQQDIMIKSLIALSTKQEKQTEKQNNYIQALEKQVNKQNENINSLEQHVKQQSEKVKLLEDATRKSGNMTLINTPKNKQSKNIAILEKPTVQHNDNITALEQTTVKHNEKVKYLEDVTGVLYGNIMSLDRQQSTQGENITCLEEQSEKQCVNLTAIENQVKQQNKKINLLREASQKQSGDITLLNTQSKSLELKVSKLAKITQSLIVNAVNTVLPRPCYIHEISDNGQFVWAFPYFKGIVLQSTPLYTRKKFLCYMKIHKHSCQEGDCMVFYLLKGQYDDKIEWPFKNKEIKGSLINVDTGVVSVNFGNSSSYTVSQVATVYGQKQIIYYPLVASSCNMKIIIDF